MSFELLTVNLDGYPSLLGDVVHSLASFGVPAPVHDASAATITITRRHQKLCPVTCRYTYIHAGQVIQIDDHDVDTLTAYQWLRAEIKSRCSPELARYLLDGFAARNRAAVRRYREGVK